MMAETYSREDVNTVDGGKSLVLDGHITPLEHSTRTVPNLAKRKQLAKQSAKVVSCTESQCVL